MSSGGYTGFLVRHVMDRAPGRGLFGNIIASYRNRKYVFLHSMRMISQGNGSALILLSKTLTTAMQEHNDFSLLLDKFKPWKHFMQHDIKDHEARVYESSKLFNP